MVSVCPRSGLARLGGSRESRRSRSPIDELDEGSGKGRGKSEKIVQRTNIITYYSNEIITGEDGAKSISMIFK